MTSLLSPKIPQAQATATMPDSASPAVLEANRNASLDIMSRAGRRSTIMSQAQNDQGREYSSTRLGAAA